MDHLGIAGKYFKHKCSVVFNEIYSCIKIFMKFRVLQALELFDIWKFLSNLQLKKISTLVIIGTSIKSLFWCTSYETVQKWPNITSI